MGKGGRGNTVSVLMLLSRVLLSTTRVCGPCAVLFVPASRLSRLTDRMKMISYPESEYNLKATVMFLSKWLRQTLMTVHPLPSSNLDDSPSPPFKP